MLHPTRTISAKNGFQDDERNSRFPLGRNQIACSVVVFAVRPCDCHEMWELPKENDVVKYSCFDIQSTGAAGPNLVSFQSRVLAFIQWAIQNLTFSRGARLITGAAPTDFNFSKEISEIKPGPVNAPR